MIGVSIIHRVTFYYFVRFFRAVSTVIFGVPLPALETLPSLGCTALFTTTEPYIYDLYVSKEASGSGNGFGVMSIIGLIPFTRRGGGVCGGARLVRPGSGSGVRRPDLSAAGVGRGLDLRPSHKPRIVSSRTFVDQTAFSVDGNSCPVKIDVSTRLFICADTCPG